MKSKTYSMLFGIIVATLLQVGSAGLRPASHAAGKVNLLRTPDGGLQPQVALDERGVLHLVYFKGEPSGGDIYYVRRDPGKTEFTSPISVNSRPGSAVAIGTIRGAQLAVGKNGRVHVAWNGRDDHGGHGAPMLYTRMNDARTGFDPQRNVMRFSGGLDGGGSIAADTSGNVYVAWHGKGDKEGEEHRRVWVARSTDDGKTFSSEVAAWNEPTGACGCCGMRAFADRQGRVHLLYRAATEKVDRDMYLLSSENQGLTFSGTLLDRWNLNACPMSSAALADGPTGPSSRPRLLAAWETQGQVYFASLDPQNPRPIYPIPAPGGAGKRKHPRIAANSRGETLLVWTDGTGWKKGGSFAWELYDSQGKPVREGGAEEGVPMWSFAAVVAENDGSFTIIY
ncbi:MAG: exo-alpha-sialidase [Chloracidobacterium sp.]|nr:exo-alpha-sialidase [Chloracidobacterium sp.]